MKLNKRLLAVLSLLGLIIILGGCRVNKVSDKQAQKIETDLAKYIVSEYSDVKTIEFKGWSYSSETGFWGTTAIVNESNKLSMSLDGLESVDNLSGTNYHPTAFKLTKRAEKLDFQEVSLNPITVVYSFERKNVNDK